MRTIFSKLTLGIGAALILATSAGAQYRPDYRDRDRRGYENRGDAVNRVIADLDSARSYNRMDRRALKRIDNARNNLMRFQQRFESKYLDRASDELRRVVYSNDVDPRTRQMLQRDLNELENFRRYDNGYRR